MPQLGPQDYVFDGLMHRPFSEALDGWRNRMPNPAEFPSVFSLIGDINEMLAELAAARRRVWELEREVLRWKPATRYTPEEREHAARIFPNREG